MTPSYRPKGRRRVWHYNSAEWEELRNFFSSFPWRNVCFVSRDASACTQEMAGVIQLGINYYISSSVTSVGECNGRCFKPGPEPEIMHFLTNMKQSNNITTAPSDARGLSNRLNVHTYIDGISSKLALCTPSSHVFWSLANFISRNFCHPTFSLRS